MSVVIQEYDIHGYYLSLFVTFFSRDSAAEFVRFPILLLQKTIVIINMRIIKDAPADAIPSVLMSICVNVARSTDWPFNCMEILSLHCVVTRSLGYEISCTDQEYETHGCHVTLFGALILRDLAAEFVRFPILLLQTTKVIINIIIIKDAPADAIASVLVSICVNVA